MCKIEKEKLERRVEISVCNLAEDFDQSALRRKRFRGSDTIPDHMDFLPPCRTTFKTPRKMPLKKLIEKGMQILKLFVVLKNALASPSI